MIRPLRKKVGTLHRIGRDYVCDDDITIRLEEMGYFSVVIPEEAFTNERREIIEVMRDGYNNAKEMAEVLNRSSKTISELLRRMLKLGVVKKLGYGKYALTEDFEVQNALELLEVSREANNDGGLDEKYERWNSIGSPKCVGTVGTCREANNHGGGSEVPTQNANGSSNSSNGFCTPPLKILPYLHRKR